MSDLITACHAERNRVNGKDFPTLAERLAYRKGIKFTEALIDQQPVAQPSLHAAYLAGYNRYGLEMAGWNRDGISDDPDKAFEAWVAETEAEKT